MRTRFIRQIFLDSQLRGEKLIGCAHCAADAEQILTTLSAIAAAIMERLRFRSRSSSAGSKQSSLRTMAKRLWLRRNCAASGALSGRSEPVLSRAEVCWRARTRHRELELWSANTEPPNRNCAELIGN